MTSNNIKKARRFRISPSFVISCVALFATFAGTALALSTDSVRSRHIVDGTIRTIDLRDNAVKAEKLADNAVTNAKLDDNAVGSIEVNDEALTASDLGDASVASSEVVDQSIAGADIGPNAIGSSELAPGAVAASDFGTTVVRTSAQAIAAGTTGGAFVNCLAGERRISGGVFVPGINNVYMQASWPNGANGWSNFVRNNTAASVNVSAYVLCLVA